MISFKDFVPRMRDAGGFFKQAEYDSFDEAAAAAGSWALNQGVRVINMETVVLPNIWRTHEEGSTDSSLLTGGGMASTWHQFVRCWYEEA